MTIEATERLACPQCGHETEVTIWRSVNVTLDPSLRDKLLERRINVFRCEQCEFASYLGVPLLYHDMRRQFCIQFYPPDAIEDDEFIGMFSREFPTYARAFPGGEVSYVMRPHLIFDMDDLAHCVAFFERLLPEVAGPDAPHEA